MSMMKIAFGLCLLAILCGPCYASHASDGNNTDDYGSLRGISPSSVTLNEPFNMAIWLDPGDSESKRPVKINMDQTQNILYRPNEFQLVPGRKQVVRVHPVKSVHGLVIIKASAEGYNDLEAVLNAGFSVRAVAPKLQKPIERGSVREFCLEFVDNHGKPVSLELPVTFRVRAFRGQFKSSDTQYVWRDRVGFEAETGCGSSVVLQLRPDVEGSIWSTQEGIVQVEAYIGKSKVFYRDRIEFKVVPRQSLMIWMAILGGVLCSAFWIAKEGTKGHPGWKSFITSAALRIFYGAVAGFISYLFVDRDILGFLGIKLDTSSPQGFIILGFLFSYIGVDTILKKFIGKVGEQPQEPKPPEQGEPGGAAPRTN
jgi:hypothetical protein